MPLNIPRSAVVFSLKNFLAGMLALYIALRAGLENPAWSVVTAYIVAQPHTGALLSKATYRICGTLIGAGVSILMVPPLVQSPVMLGLAIAVWLGGCVFVSLLDRTARGYLFALAGYSSCIIIFPVLTHPQDVFVYAAARFQEISLGILCSGIVHAIVFPVSTASIVSKRLDVALSDARALCIAALGPGRAAETGPDWQRVAAAINELHELLLHLRFEEPHGGTRLQSMRVLLARLERLLPLSLAVADRIDELLRQGPLTADLQRFLADTRQWFAETSAQQIAGANVLLQFCASLRPSGHRMRWNEVLQYNLLEHTSALIRQHIAVLRLNAGLDVVGTLTDMAAGPDTDGDDMPTKRRLERDLRGAAGAGLATILTVLAGNALWIASGWPAGYSAVMMAGVYFAVYPATPNPSQMLKNKFVGVVLRLALGAVYVVAILPAISGFGQLVMALAPALLLSGVMMGMPRFSAMGFNFVVGIFSPSIVDRSFHTDLQLYLNTGIATLTGIYFAIMMMSATRFLWVDGTVRRILAAGRRDIADLRFLKASAQPQWRSRMAHRIGLLAPRLASSPEAIAARPSDALRDMMTGSALALLHAASRNTTPAAAEAMRKLIQQVAAHYRLLERRPQLPPSPGLRARIDACLADAAGGAEPENTALLALTSLRRNLFPDDHSMPAGVG